ncbi:MAG: ABC transporter substrate-binding protein [Armatimonadetes bacterium]|nr:ABC transporter substrate-binding protein [Armatimonadota bacterium]
MPVTIVPLAPSHTGILFALGLGDQVAGITAHCDYPPEAAGKPRAGLFARPDLAKIVSLQPGLVVAGGNITGSQGEELRKEGIKVMDFLPRTVAELFAGMEKIAEIAGAFHRNIFTRQRELSFYCLFALVGWPSARAN